MAYINLPGPIVNSSLESDSRNSASTVQSNFDLVRLLIGSGRQTRILNQDGIPLSIETFFQNVNRYGNAFSNRFFVLIDGPGFVRSEISTFQRFKEFTGVDDIVAGADAIVGGGGSNINLNSGNFLQDPNAFSGGPSPAASLYSAYERLSVLCNSASFPKADIATSKLQIIPSMQENVAQYRNFAENSTFTLKFYNSSSMFERNYFESWMNTVINMKTGIANYYDEYAKPFSVSVIKLPKNSAGPVVTNNLSGEKKVLVENGMGSNIMSGFLYGVKYMECYPTSINNVEFSYGQSALTETEITFSYKYYLSPSKIQFLKSGINPSSPYSKYLDVLGNLINNRGKVSYDPQMNNTDNLANAINGTVNRVTNVVAAIQQIY